MPEFSVGKSIKFWFKQVILGNIELVASYLVYNYFSKVQCFQV